MVELFSLSVIPIISGIKFFLGQRFSAYPFVKWEDITKTIAKLEDWLFVGLQFLNFIMHRSIIKVLHWGIIWYYKNFVSYYQYYCSTKRLNYIHFTGKVLWIHAIISLNFFTKIWDYFFVFKWCKLYRLLNFLLNFIHCFNNPEKHV